MSRELLLLGAVLLLFSLGLLLWSLFARKDLREITQQRLKDILRIDPTQDKEQAMPLLRLLRRFGAHQAGNANTGRMQVWRRELRVLLSQAGWHKREARILIKGGLALAPFAAALLATVVVLSSGAVTSQGLAGIFLSFGAGLLLPRYVLRFLAERRREQIVEEVPVMVRMVSVLFEAGLSLESTLKTLRDEARWILPNLNVEIGRMLMRVAAGMDRVEALDQMARELDIQELTDAVAVLGHTATAGGSVRQSLARIADVIEDRNRTRLRERVGQLSAKMTVVMVVFLFPALFIFLAGPGFVAIAGALGGLR
ncbi:MAG: type II secretion system F family protein [Gammaproteobacteria bacterium]|nr:type II secretion system F family protein [Gammaproteobacteria bacterium]